MKPGTIAPATASGIINDYPVIQDVPVDPQAAGRVIPRDLMSGNYRGQQNTFRIYSIVEGQHAITEPEFTASRAYFSFEHNLQFKPTVVGSFVNTVDGVSRPLPYAFRPSTKNYFAAPETVSASVDIDSVNETRIFCSFHTYDLEGLSWLISNATLKFRFYCLRETLIS